MIVKELTQYAKTGHDTQYLLVLSDHEANMHLIDGSLELKIHKFANLLHTAFIDFLKDKFSEQLKKESEYALKALMDQSNEQKVKRD